jgi:hypothetical protein
LSQNYLGACMYQPILKGKKAEFDAWQNVRASKRKHAIPLFELVVKEGTDSDLASFRDRLLSSTHGGDIVAVDVRSLGSNAVESSSGLRPYSWLVRETQSSRVKIRPVIYLDDDVVVARDALTDSRANNELIVLRIGGGMLTQLQPTKTTASSNIAQPSESSLRPCIF